MTKLGQKRTAKIKKKRVVGRRGLQRKADILFSKAVRERAGNKCEYCGKKTDEAGRPLTLHCHHGVVHRRYLNTRYERDNCCSVCVSCHSFLGDFPRINYEWFKKRIGLERVEALENLARTYKKFDYLAVIKNLES